MNQINLVLICFSILICLFVDNVQSLEAEQIIGGAKATRGEFPYHVDIQVFGLSLCSGSIIDENHVITAGHCVFDKKKREFYRYPFQIVGGTININIVEQTQVTSYIEKIYILESYGKLTKGVTGTGDIAVMKLKTPLDFKSNRYINKLELPPTPSRSYVGQHAIITGFGWNWVLLEEDPETGKLEETDGGSYGKLRYAETTVLSREGCQKNYKWTITDDHICARVIQQDPMRPEGVCSGDSGGPLVYDKKYLIGVLSSSPTGCRENRAAAVYTRVTSYLGFIEKALKDEPSEDILTYVLPTRSRYYV